MEQRLLELIEHYCEENNKDKRETINTYESFVELGKMAGLTDEELFVRLSEKLKFSNAEPKTVAKTTNTWSISIKLVHGGDLEIVSDDDSGIRFHSDEDFNTYYEVSSENSYFCIKPKRQLSWRKHLINCDLVIYVGNDITLDQLLIEGVNSDVDLSALETSVKRVDISLVSGDLCADNITCDHFKYNSVSGDLKINQLKADTMSFNTVSGDVDINDIIALNATFNTVSGDVSVKHHQVEYLRTNSLSGYISF